MPRPPRRRNPTLVGGGILSATAGACGIGDVVLALEALRLLAGLFVLGATIVFAIGLRGGGSIVGFSVWGRIGLIGFGAGCCAVALLDIATEDAGLQVEPWAKALIVAVIAAFAVIAVYVIVNERALPRPWRFVPASGLGVVVFAVVTTVARSDASSEDGLTSRGLLGSLLWLAYGVIAIAISSRIGHLESHLPRWMTPPGDEPADSVPRDAS